MLRVAIVGCGKIADAHASQIRRIRGAQLVGVCDREPLMAQQLAERFDIPRYVSNLSELLRHTRPHVVHVTTPPDSHADIAMACLDHGCHVYVEKPFTLHAAEAERLVAVAQAKRLKLTVGHDGNFSHVARRMRRLIDGGYLGGAPVHMESYYGYDLGDMTYASAFLADTHHWVRRLPGRLLHNIISHGIARIAEFLGDDPPRVIAYGCISAPLRALGEQELIDELRVIVAEARGATAYFTFSSQMRPSVNQFRIYGPRNGLELDQDHEVLLKLRGQKLRSYAETFIGPMRLAEQHVANVVANARTFLARDFHVKAGLKCLIESFYRSIVDETPVPIPYREILQTARIMDAIFAQLAPAPRMMEEPVADAASRLLFATPGR